jgi:hypothetical protein
MFGKSKDREIKPPCNLYSNRKEDGLLYIAGYECSNEICQTVQMFI